jgi:U5 small nuclear ribonucleoprotein component
MRPRLTPKFLLTTFSSSIDPDPALRLSPENGNVVFASTDMHWCFTLRSFAQMYSEAYGRLDVNAFADRLWGDIYFSPSTRKFTRKAEDPETPRTFVHFILTPLYKLYSQVLSEDTETLKETLGGLGILLKPAMFKMDVRPLLKVVTEQFFGPPTGLVDMIVEHIPSPLEGTASKVFPATSTPSTYLPLIWLDYRSRRHIRDLRRQS